MRGNLPAPEGLAGRGASAVLRGLAVKPATAGAARLASAPSPSQRGSRGILRQAPSLSKLSLFMVATAGVSTLSALPCARTYAADLLGLYAGGAIGQSRVEASSQGYTPDSFKENHSAYKVMVGIHPLPLLGAEVDYIDFGHPRGNLDGQQADANLKGAAAFGVLYLPVPVVDVYAKAGISRLQSSLSSVVFPGFHLNRTDAHFAAGAGVQYKFNALAIRTEYEYFTAAGEHPNLLSLGLTWTF